MRSGETHFRQPRLTAAMATALAAAQQKVKNVRKDTKPTVAADAMKESGNSINKETL